MSLIEQNIGALDPAPHYLPERPPLAALTNGILVRSPNWLGDAVMTFPALRVLKKMLPGGAPLVVLCPPALQELYRALPIVDRLLLLHAPHTAWTKEEYTMIRESNQQTGLLFSNSLRDAIAMRRCHIHYLYGAAARGRSILLARSFKYPKWQKGALNHCHHTKMYLSIVEALGAPVEPVEFPEILPVYPLDTLPGKIRALCDHPALMTITPGAAYGAAKRWGSDHFHEVAAWHIANGGIVVTLGTQSERLIGTEICRDLPENKVFNLMGETSFTELLYLLKAAKVSVANDSGLMHLAAALGTPGVAIFGPTDYCATGPVSDHWKLLFVKQQCAPCFERECPSGSRRCMGAISAAMVIDALQGLLA